MFKLMAGVIVGMGTFFHALIGGGHNAPSTEVSPHDGGPRQFMGSSTDPRMHNASSTLGEMRDRMREGTSTEAMKPFGGIQGIFGTVTAINGTTLTVSAERRMASSSATTTV